MKVVITNTVTLNGGDAAILLAIEQHVRNVFGEDVDIVTADTQPDLARAYYPGRRIISPLYLHAFPPKGMGRFAKLRGLLRFGRWYSSLPRLYLAAYLLSRGDRRTAQMLTTVGEWETLREYSEADVIVSTGGTYLVENYWLAPRIFEFRISLLLGKPLVLYTQSMGPFQERRTRSALRDIFRNAALILVRDEPSMQHLHDLCEPNEVNVCLAADAAFSLADPHVLEQARAAQMPSDRRLRVAISVRRWPYFREASEESGMRAYTAAIAELVEHLVLDHDADVVFLSTCQGVKGYAYDDAEVAADVFSRVDPFVQMRVEIDADFHPPAELLASLGRFDLVVATRMHMAILSLAAGTPVLPIAYEFKTEELFDRLGLRARVHDINHLSGGTLSESVDRLLKELPSVRSSLFRRVEDERRRAGIAEDALAMVKDIRLDESPQHD